MINEVAVNGGKWSDLLDRTHSIKIVRSHNPEYILKMKNLGIGRATAFFKYGICDGIGAGRFKPEPVKFPPKKRGKK